MIADVITFKIPKRVLGDLVRWFNSTTCRIMHGGHELYVVRNDPKKIYQECVLCGHKTNGWEIKHGR